MQSFNELSVDRTLAVLVLGGGEDDRDILSACGFENIVLSDLCSAELSLDAESIALEDDSYPIVFAHAVLHHCRSPHKAVGEMVRVSQKHVFFVEPNDSWTLAMLVRLGLSFPYEIAAVADHGYSSGGMRNGPIPNYIYRWTRREVSKCVAAYQPERQCSIQTYPYWDFYATADELLLRRESHVASLASAVGAKRLLLLLHGLQSILNAIPFLRRQGNKFFCAISKQDLQPWIRERGEQYGLVGNWPTSQESQMRSTEEEIP